MRNFYFITILLLFCSCSTGLIEKDLKNNLFEEYPIESRKNHFDKFKKGEQANSYIYKGFEFYPAPNKEYWEIFIYPQKHQFYTIVYQYDKKNYKLRKKGKVFGWNPNIETLKIGIWYEYDENGTLVKETDEDKKFGKFDYNQLLKFLDKENTISLRKGLKNDINRQDKMLVNFNYSATSNKKLWNVVVFTGAAYGIANLPGEIGERVSQPGKTYYIDGNTGEVIKRNEETLEYYKEIGFN